MNLNGIAQPPQSAKAFEIDIAEIPDIDILYPKSGMVFQIDPVLHEEYQRIRLQATVDAALADPAWIINEQPYSAPTTKTYWTLQEGSHDILLQATDPQGRLVQSPVVTIRVLPANALNTAQEASFPDATTLR